MKRFFMGFFSRVNILGIDKLQKDVRFSGLAALAAFFVFIFSLFGIIIFRSRNTN